MTDSEEKRMTFTEHLGELRIRIIRSGIVVLVMVVVCYIFSNAIIEMLVWPLAPAMESGVITDAAGTPQEGVPVAEKPAAEKPVAVRPQGQFTVLNPLEFVLVKLKVSGYGGLLVAFPFVLWQLCAFVFPGLHPKERRAVQILIYGCSILALVGVMVAYFGVLPLVLPYLMNWVPEGWNVQLRANETLSILIKLLVGFAIAFQFPMIALTLVYMELLTPETLKKYRKIAVVGIAFASALLTPPDPFSMIVMMMPLVLLYESSIWLSYLVIRHKKSAAT